MLTDPEKDGELSNTVGVRVSELCEEGEAGQSDVRLVPQVT